jgi:RNA polymerase primary sigma factor
MGDGQETELGQLIEDRSLPSPAEAASQTLMIEELYRSLSALAPREERILCLRYGLDDGESRTLEEVGKHLGFTRERVRQIERRALRKLRHAEPIRSFAGEF